MKKVSNRFLTGALTMTLMISAQAAPIAINNSDFSTAGSVNNSNIVDWTRYNSTSNGWGVNTGSDGAPDAPSAFLGNSNGLRQATTYSIALDEPIEFSVVAAATGGGNPDLVLEFYADDGVPTLLFSETIDLGTTTKDWQPYSSTFTLTAGDPNAALAGNNLMVGVRTTGPFIGVDTISVIAGDALFWDGTSIDGDANGGSGSWDVGTTSNWDDGATGGSDVVWVNGGDAVFGGDAAGTVTLAEPVTANTLTFELTGYDISGSTLTVDGSSPEIFANADATISSDLAGASALSKSGDGTLSLTGDGSGFTGGLSVTAGRVDIDGAFGSAVTVTSSLGGEGNISGNLTLESGSTLSLIIDNADALAVTGDLIINGTVQLDLDAAPTGDVTILNYSGSLIGNLSDLVPPTHGSINDIGGTLVLQNNATQSLIWHSDTSDTWEIGGPDDNWDSTDGFFFNGDDVSFTDTVNALFSGTVTVVGNPEPGSMTVTNSTQPYTFSGTGIGGSGSLTKNGDGIVTLGQLNTYSGGTTVNDGILDLTVGGPAGAIQGDVTVNGPGNLQLTAVNALGWGVGTRVETLNVFDGGLVDHIGGGDHGLGIVHNLRGSTIQTTNGPGTGRFSMGGGSSVNSLASADSSVIAGRATVRQNPVPFDVEDGSAETDLLVSADLVSQGAGTLSISKSGDGIMLLSGTNDTQTWGTSVTGGCLLLDSIASIPSDLTQVSVAADAGFGGIVGAANLLNSDITNIVSNVVWDGSGDALLVLDTNGANVTVSSDIVGNFKILKKGAGDLTLTGTVTVNDTIIESGNVILDPGGDVLIIDAITTTAGTNSGVKVTISFTAGGDVDIYATDDLSNWGAPIAEDVSSSPFIEDDLSDSKRFYVIVKAGEIYP